MIRDPKKAYRAKVPEFTGQVSADPGYPEILEKANEIMDRTGAMPESRRLEDLLIFIKQKG